MINFLKKKKDKEVAMLALPLIPPIQISAFVNIDYIILDKDELVFHTDKQVTSAQEEQKIQFEIDKILKKYNKIQLITLIKEKGIHVYEN